MIKMFGEKINGLDYQIRKGVYAVIFNSERDRDMIVRKWERSSFLGSEGGIEHSVLKKRNERGEVN